MSNFNITQSTCRGPPKAIQGKLTVRDPKFRT